MNDTATVGATDCKWNTLELIRGIKEKRRSKFILFSLRARARAHTLAPDKTEIISTNYFLLIIAYIPLI